MAETLELLQYIVFYDPIQAGRAGRATKQPWRYHWHVGPDGIQVTVLSRPRGLEGRCDPVIRVDCPGSGNIRLPMKTTQEVPNPRYAAAEARPSAAAEARLLQLPQEL